MESLDRSIPYFSKSHLTAVTLLREVSEKSAFDAVFSYFLLKTVSLWQFSGPFRCNDQLLRQRPFARPPQNYDEISFDFLLTDSLQSKPSDPTFVTTLLDLFSQDVGMEMPEVGLILFYGGVRFVLSTVDSFLLMQLLNLVRGLRSNSGAPRPVSPEIGLALPHAFTLRLKFVHYPPVKHSEPVPKSTSSDLTSEKLEDHKRLHEFLFNSAAGLKQFQALVASKRRLLRLAYSALSDKMLKCRVTFSQPAVFWLYQRTRYGQQLFHGFALRALVGYIRQHSADEFEAEINERIERRMRQYGVAEAVLLGVTDYVNEWKRRFNQEHPDHPHVLCAPSKDVEYPLCHHFFSAVEAMTAGFVLGRMSMIPFPLGSPPDNDRLLTMINADCLEKSVWKCPNLEADDFDERIVIGGDLRFLIARADETLGVIFGRNFEEPFGHGFMVPVFLEIERMIRASLHNVNPESKLDLHRELMGRLFAGRDPVFLRTMLFKLMVLIKQLIDVPQPSMPDLARLGDPIGSEIRTAFVHLRDWFGYIPDIFEVNDGVS
jgi:hypothetical protein